MNPAWRAGGAVRRAKAHYSGAADALDEYHITMKVLSIEQTFALMF